MRLLASAGITLTASCWLASSWLFNAPGFGLKNHQPSNSAEELVYISSHHAIRLASRVAPKVMIISMFDPESRVWYENMPDTEFGDIRAINITTPGLSPLYPYVHCTATGEICQVTVGEAEINAAATVSALALSPKFHLRYTYFMVAGIAGINPKVGTQGSVSFSRFAIQVTLQYELDAREMPENFSTGYFSYGTAGPNEYPSILYGTEVFEVNENLRDAAAELAKRATLADSAQHRDYGKRYLELGERYLAAAEPPTIVKVDSATSDVYYSGQLLSDAFENITNQWTNGTGVYGMAAQEENAILEVLLRMAVEGIVDFGRIIIMRTGSNFDRPPPSVSVYEHLVVLDDQAGLGIASKNIFLAGIEVVRGIMTGWECTFKQGIKPTNYIGDIWGSLGGHPDFGLGSMTGGKGVRTASEREAMAQKRAEILLAKRGRFAK